MEIKKTFGSLQRIFIYQSQGKKDVDIFQVKHFFQKGPFSTHRCLHIYPQSLVLNTRSGQDLKEQLVTAMYLLMTVFQVSNKKTLFTETQ